MQNHELILLIVFICILLIPLLLCIIGNFKNKIIIFYNYNDLILTFVTVVFPFLYYYTFFFMFQNKVINILFLIVEFILFIFLYRITYICNKKNVFITICTLYTKLFLSFLFFFYILQLVVSNKKKNSKYSSRLPELLMTATVIPAMTKFIQNHNNENIKRAEYEI